MMDPVTESPKPGYRYIASVAWPIMLANAAVPLLGLADTSLIGRRGTTQELGAIALGAMIFGFVYWSFGFLRMGTTGFVAQASGAGKEAEVRAAVVRAMMTAVVLGMVMILLQVPIVWIAFQLLGGTAEIEAIARRYVVIRIWGAPATLAMFVILGTLIGLGRSRTLLGLQVFMNGLNIALDVWFAGVLGWGATGIAAGTLIAEWSTALVGAVVIVRILQQRRPKGDSFLPWNLLRNAAALWRTVQANADIMTRTLALLLGFGWFTQQGALLGETTLAANHVLLQFMSFSAFFLDGYAFATESLVGQAIGARNRSTFDAVVKRSSVLAGLTGVGLGAGWWLFGNAIIAAMTNLPEVREAAAQFLPYTAIYVAVSTAAFQLDGVFIGATRTRDMRNASLASTAVFVGLAWLLVSRYGNGGLWAAFIVYVIARGATLGVLYPRLRKSVG